MLILANCHVATKMMQNWTKVTNFDESFGKWAGRNLSIFGPIGPKFCMVLDQCLSENFGPIGPK